MGYKKIQLLCLITLYIAAASQLNFNKHEGQITITPPTTIEPVEIKFNKKHTVQGVESRGDAYNERQDYIIITATAYDLSVASCGKSRNHPEYGITASGIRAKTNRTVAVDPKVIPLGTYLYIEFPEEYSDRNGIYVAEDTGSAIKGNKIDIFLGEDKPGENTINKECFKFGKQQVKVFILKD